MYDTEFVAGHSLTALHFLELVSNHYTNFNDMPTTDWL